MLSRREPSRRALQFGSEARPTQNLRAPVPLIVSLESVPTETPLVVPLYVPQ